MIETYKELVRSYKLYWQLYGGFKALALSPYLHASLLVTVVCAPVWLGDDGGRIWPEAAISILPNLMGFSIAGMSILLAFSSPKMLRTVSEDGRVDSYYVTTIVNFFHFILVQTLAMLLAVVGRHYSAKILSAVGTFLLIYAIFVGLAMAMQLLQTGRIVNAASSLDSKDEE